MRSNELGLDYLMVSFKSGSYQRVKKLHKERCAFRFWNVLLIDESWFDLHYWRFFLMRLHFYSLDKWADCLQVLYDNVRLCSFKLLGRMTSPYEIFWFICTLYIYFAINYQICTEYWLMLGFFSWSMLNSWLQFSFGLY